MLSKIRGWFTSSKYPSEGWVVTANEEASHTPDLLSLEERELHLMFLPCELQEKHAEGHMIESLGIPLWKAFTKHNYAMYRDRETGRGILLEEACNPVKGELWVMSYPCYSLLDKYKENGVKSNRHRIEIQVPYSVVEKGDRASKITPKVADIVAWAYVGERNYWHKELDGGYRYPPVRLYRPNNPFKKPFHYYHLNEYKK